MIQLLAFCICASLACLAIHIIFTWPNMLFYVEDAPVKLAWFEKPIYGCLTCMASVWGSVFYLAFHYNHIHIFDWLFCVLIICGLNTLLCVILEKMSDNGC